MGIHATPLVVRHLRLARRRRKNLRVFLSFFNWKSRIWDISQKSPLVVRHLTTRGVFCVNSHWFIPVNSQLRPSTVMKNYRMIRVDVSPYGFVRSQLNLRLLDLLNCKSSNHWTIRKGGNPHPDWVRVVINPLRTAAIALRATVAIPYASTSFSLGSFIFYPTKSIYSALWWEISCMVSNHTNIIIYDNSLCIDVGYFQCLWLDENIWQSDRVPLMIMNCRWGITES